MLVRSSRYLALSILVVGCGGDTSAFTSATDAGKSGAAGASGSANGGAQSNGGSGPSGAGGTGQSGAAGSGQSGASGSGQAGAVGGGGTGAGGGASTGGASAGDAGMCPAPVDPNNTALCLTFSPENIDAESDPALDKRGVFIVQVFDTPNPPKQNASQVALFERLVPTSSSTGGQIALDALRPIRAIAAFPATVYVRALFIDNPGPFATGDLGYGSWVGGVNFLDGIQKDEPLLPVPIQQGQGNAVDVPLVALRRLDVTVHLSATPVGDGQGPLAVVVVNDQDPAKKPPPVGYAATACANVAAGDVHLTGFFVGAGRHWVTGILKDLGGTGDIPPGSLAALSVNAQTYRIPAEMNVPASAYSASVTIDLSFVAPMPADAGSVPPNSCADLGIGGDAGP
jgi:hypothetical protein